MFSFFKKLFKKEIPVVETPKIEEVEEIQEPLSLKDVVVEAEPPIIELPPPPAEIVVEIQPTPPKTEDVIEKTPPKKKVVVDDELIKKIKNQEIIKRMVEEFSTDNHNIHTPYSLCREIIDKLKSYTTLKGKKVLVFSNPEFVLELKEESCEIYFASSCPKKLNAAKKLKAKILEYNGDVNNLKTDMKFDVILGNPPYQSDNERDPLWEKFIPKAFEHLKEGGVMSLVHPSAWRKPKHKLFPEFKKRNLKYLEIHSQNDGMSVFGVGTRYDWYVLENKEYEGVTEIVDEDGVKNIVHLNDFNCLPHAELQWFEKLLTKSADEKIGFIYNRSNYATDKSWVSLDKKEDFIYPVVHATKAKGTRFVYSKRNDKGHFGIKKVIMGMASPENGFYDSEGKYGLSQDCYAFVVENDSDGKNIEKILKTEKFKKLTKLCKWAGFKTDHGAFMNFKKDFWKEFI